MGKKIRYLLLPLVAALFAAVSAPLPAQAATGYDRCPDQHYCMFSGLDGGGDMIAVQGNTPDLGALGMDDRARSDWNRTPSRIYLFSGTNYTGCAATTSPAGTPSDRGNFFIDYREFFSSVQFDGPGGASCGTPPGEDG